MAAWVDSPIVSFSRDGRVVELGRSGEAPALHLHGSTGLGLAPVDIKSSERLSGDGSIVRGVRYGVRDVYVPLLLSGTELSVTEARRDLTRLLAPHLGPVDVRIEDPVTGSDRMIRGYLRDGMEGDFGTDFGRSWHRLGLTFECPDPWWLGPERTTELRIKPGSKPFISDRGYERKNLAYNPSFESGLDQGAIKSDWSANGTGGVDSAWAGSGSRSVRVEAVPGGSNDTTFYPWGWPVVTDMTSAYSMLSGRTFTIGATIRLAAPQTGTLNAHARRIGVNIRSADGTTTYNWAQSEAAPNVAGAHRVKVTFTVPPGSPTVSVRLSNGSNTAPVWWDQLTVEEGETSGEYFDGDTAGASWAGVPHASQSGFLSPSPGTPFFPVVLAQSSIQGKFDVDIAGDGPVWPSWEVIGPGSDLTIASGPQRIELLGEVPVEDPVTIDTAAGRISPDRWGDMSLRSRLFPLEPGPQTLTVTMVGASTDTLVRLTYRERFLEGV